MDGYLRKGPSMEGSLCHTGIVKSSHCQGGLSVQEEDLLACLSLSPATLAQRPHEQSGHGFRDRDNALAQ